MIIFFTTKEMTFNFRCVRSKKKKKKNLERHQLFCGEENPDKTAAQGTVLSEVKMVSNQGQDCMNQEFKGHYLTHSVSQSC